MTPAQLTFWENFVKRTGIDCSSVIVEASMPGDKTIADDLVTKYLKHTKTAGSGLVKSYEMAGEPLPKIGNYWIILDSKEHPKCIAKTMRVEVNMFIDVSEEIAIAEGDGSLENWRQVHRDFFGNYLEKLEIRDLDQALIVTEFFEILI